MSKNPSPIERKVKSYLQEIDKSFVSQFIVGKYICDFSYPDRKLIIECDGADWHKDKEKEAIRDLELQRDGYKVLHLLGWQCWNPDIAIPMIREFLDTCKTEKQDV